MKVLVTRSWLALIIVFARPAVAAHGPDEDSGWIGPYRLSSVDGEVRSASISADEQGIVHALWSETGLIGDDRSIIQYARFDGQSWSQPVDIYVTWPGRTISSVSSDVDQFGVIHLAWSEGARGPLYYSSAPTESAGSGSGWQQPQRIDVRAAKVKLFVDSQGVIHLAFLTLDGEEPGVYFFRSKTRGRSWDNAVRIDPDIPTNAIPSQLGLSVDGMGGVHLLWTYSAADLPGFPQRWIRYANSLDGGTTWSAPSDIATATEAEDNRRVGAAVISTNGNIVHIIWASDTKTHRSHIVSLDQGRTWSPSARVFGELHGAAGDDLEPDGTGAIHFVGQIRWPQAIYELTWVMGEWSDPEQIYLLRSDSQEDFGDRVHAHSISLAFAASDQMVITFTSSPGDPQAILYGMHQLVSDNAMSPTSAAASVLADIPQPLEEPPTSPVQSEVQSSSAISAEVQRTDRQSSSGLDIISFGLLPSLFVVVTVVALTMLMRRR